MSLSSDARSSVSSMTGEEFMHAWPLNMEHIAEQLNPTLTQPHRFPQPDYNCMQLESLLALE
ncbi:hypothetical protein SK128_018017, partial [Halocaridina rubra]